MPANRAVSASTALCLGLLLGAASDPPGPALASVATDGCRAALSRFVSASIEASRRPSSAALADRREEAGVAYLERGCRVGTLLVARYAVAEAARSGDLRAVLE